MKSFLHPFLAGQKSILVRIVVLTASILSVTGCLTEQSLILRPDESRKIHTAREGESSLITTREWLRDAHAQLADLLPPNDPQPLLTEDLTDASGNPVDVFEHFDVNPGGLQSILSNYDGLKCTAQGANQDLSVDSAPPPWPGFEDAWIEMPDGVRLSSRLGFAKSGDEVATADCIVILPGFFGDNGVVRTRDLAHYLLGSGYHVLALEMRGHGQTERTQPDISYTFGVRETDDLLHVADWLQSKPQIRRTGLIGFCWSANTALLTAWDSNRSMNDPSITPTIATQLHALPGVERYAAGILSFSPIPQWEHLVDLLETEYSILSRPVYATLQKTNRQRMEHKRYRNPSGSLRDLIKYEYERCGTDLPTGIMEGHLFLRLAPYDNRPFHRKLDRVNVPVVIVHAADDPLSPAQDVADLIAHESNPLIAGIILPSGGHVGFATYAREYYFSLITNFFDPQAGAAATVSIPYGESMAGGDSRTAASHFQN